MRLSLLNLSDRVDPVTFGTLKSTDLAIQEWSYQEGGSEAYKFVQREHEALHSCLDITSSILNGKLKDDDPIPAEDWEKIKPL